MFHSALMLICFSYQTSFSQDHCQSIGWANYDGQNFVGPTTGGGNSAVIEVTTFADLKKAVESKVPAVIHVMNSMGAGYTGNTGDVLNFKSNKTVLGVKPGIVVKCSWQIKRSRNITIRNLQIQGPGNSNSNQNWDAVNIDSTQRIWVDHCVVMDGEDGNIDIAKGADNVSVTWCVFTYSANGTLNLSNLVGSNDNEAVSHDKLNISYINCWWKDVTERQPRVRFGKIHVVNCLYSMPKGFTSSTGCAAGFMSNLRVENCDYYNINNPCILFPGTTEGGAFPIGCRFTNCTGTTTGGSAGNYSVFTPPYEYASWIVPTEQVKAQVEKLAGNTLADPTKCKSIPTSLENELVTVESAAIFPNPSKSNFHLKTDIATDVQIFNAVGNLIERHPSVSNFEFGSNLKPGIYFLKTDSKLIKLIKE